MNNPKESNTELRNGEYTEYIFDATCFGEPVDPQTAEDVIDGISRALQVEAHPAFLEGLAERLTQLGIACTAEDKDTMLAEVKRRYKAILGKPCLRTVQEWIRGTTPGITNRQNNYDLCYALEMDFQQTAVFFQKHYLTMPFNVKSKVDAVFMYALYHKKPYSVVTDMLSDSKGFVPQKNAHTKTSQIISVILETDDDDRFMSYLSEHCYDNKQQFQLARSVIKKELADMQSGLLSYTSDRKLTSLTISELLGFKYQKESKIVRKDKLPKRFVESLPNDVTLGRILNDDVVSYENLRKTLMLLKLYNFYSEADNCDRNTVCRNLMDFCDELDAVLLSCGFSQLYVRHPFDCLVMYCANSYDPIETLHCVIDSGRN